MEPIQSSVEPVALWGRSTRPLHLTPACFTPLTVHCLPGTSLARRLTYRNKAAQPRASPGIVLFRLPGELVGSDNVSDRAQPVGNIDAWVVSGSQS
jgi:hypothetical protein